MKDILNYEGIYKIDKNGNIYPINPRNKHRTCLKPSLDTSGYQIVSLVKNSIKKTRTVHRLLAETFYGKSNLDVNHINGIKHDNRLENIEFCTKSHNMKHAIDTGLLNPNYKKIAIDKRKKVGQFINGKLIHTYESAHSAARINKYNRGNISTACRLNKKCEGYYWKYI